MEAAVEVARPMGSPEGFSSGGVVVGEVRWHTENACSSGGKKAPAFWRKIPDSEVRVEACRPSSLHIDDAVNDHVSGNMKSHPPTLDIDAKPVRQRSGKIARKNSGCTKRSGMAHMEVSKNKSGLHDVNGAFPELVSSSASCNVSGTPWQRVVPIVSLSHGLIHGRFTDMFISRS
ncbi:hypothetical protein PHJA_001406000 [Phtheirospermum japonicum]|uniref:Uncharacterized protein n=1 Tax=Phtheirospermum japonicum TaxID=374723 RepID=A0A830C663_9LAMI|nr:hypothetical protein PHJA_001406000 [Phtheirospermum japonicum]